MTTGPVDHAVLDELRTELADDGLMQEIISTFLDDCSVRMDRIEQAAQREDGPVLSAQAHALKGSSGTLGARDLSRLCRELEELGVDSGSDSAVDLVGQLVREHQRVRAALLRMRE